jgi:hypothetical protein
MSESSAGSCADGSLVDYMLCLPFSRAARASAGAVRESALVAALTGRGT